MRLAALFSGGKDSAFAIYAAQEVGHSVECLVSVRPKSDESHLLHFPNLDLTCIQATSMGIPHLVSGAQSVDPSHEADTIRDMLAQARDEFEIDGIVHGGILSDFQRSCFGKTCRDLGLEEVAPLWGVDQARYMHLLLDYGFEFVVTSVTADGLDGSWLGRIITQQDLDDLERLSKKHSFNMSFEGGEAETLVLDCPLFSSPVVIRNAKKYWDGYRGRFEIQAAGLDIHA